MDLRPGGGVDRPAHRAGGGAGAARLGVPAAAHRAQPAGPAPAARLSQRLKDAVVEERARPPDTPVAVGAFGEHRARRPQAGAAPGVGHKRGRRPVAAAGPRCQWLCIYGFVRPTTGAPVWFLGNTVNTALSSAVLARFAAAVGAGPGKRVILGLDGAGWHGGGKLTPPEGVRLVFLPPYTPELQPAEHLWPLTNEAVANRHFANLGALDAALAARCLALADQPETITAHTRFRWWPAAA